MITRWSEIHNIKFAVTRVSGVDQGTLVLSDNKSCPPSFQLELYIQISISILYKDELHRGSVMAGRKRRKIKL